MPRQFAFAPHALQGYTAGMHKCNRVPALLVVLIAGVCLVSTASADEPQPATPPVPLLGTEPGQVRDDNALKMKLVWCPPGFVTMEQADKSRTPANVFVSRGYWIGRCEVTRAEWTSVMQSEPWNENGFPQPRDDMPATKVCWYEATQFCRVLTRREREARRLPHDWEYALPTEAQWERACRARADTLFSFGDDNARLHEFGWYRDNTVNVGDLYAHRVGQKKPNAWGLHDMHGNVWEWCRDVYAEKLPGGRDPEVTEPGHERVDRGGAWNYDAADCRSATRGHIAPTTQLNSVGFRVVLTPVRPAADPEK